MIQKKMKFVSHRELRVHREELFCRSRECPTGKTHLSDFSLVDVFALADVSARAKDHSLCGLCDLERSGREKIVLNFVFL
jgi:hypothetical protein